MNLEGIRKEAQSVRNVRQGCPGRGFGDVPSSRFQGLEPVRNRITTQESGSVAGGMEPQPVIWGCQTTMASGMTKWRAQDQLHDSKINQKGKGRLLTRLRRAFFFTVGTKQSFPVFRRASRSVTCLTIWTCMWFLLEALKGFLAVRL